MSEIDEQIFQSSNNCWACDRWFDIGDNKVREHCHITGKYRGSTHWSCNINLRLTMNVSVIFHNFRGYDIQCHLIIRDIGKSDVKVNVIPNGLEKYKVFTINNNFFIDSMQFMNSSLDALVKNFSDNDFTYLSQEFSVDLLELVKQ